MDRPIHIDLRKIIKGKNRLLSFFLPCFVIRWLERLLHVSEVNDFLARNYRLEGLDFADQIVKEFNPQLEFEGLEHILPEGRFLLTANHPLGGLDGIVLLSTVGKIRRDLLFPVNDLLMNITNLRSLFISINKTGKNAPNVRSLMAAFASDHLILYFPAGLCSRLHKDGIYDLEWMPTIITQSRKTHRSIIPTYIDAENSPRFYAMARLRKRLRLGINLEQLWLVDELYQFNGKKIRTVVGAPIPYEVFDKRHSDQEWAQILKAHVYRLKDHPQEPFPYLLPQANHGKNH